MEEADLAIGTLIDKLKADNLYSDTRMLFITDHSGIKKGDGGVFLSEMQIPWSITGPMVKKVGLTNIFNSNKNTSQIIAEILGLKNLPKFGLAQFPLVFLSSH